jgi:hypothetical protein
MIQARNYIGIPFKAHGSDREGLDCFGLIRLVYKEAFDIKIDPVPYPDPQDLSENAVWIKDTQKDWTETNDPEPGDLISFKILGHESHLGIVYDPGKTFLHSDSSAGVVIERMKSIMWSKRIGKFYRHKFKGSMSLIVHSQWASKRKKSEIQAGPTIFQIIKSSGINPSAVTVILNDQQIPIDFWSCLRPKPGVSLFLNIMPQGSKESRKNALRVIATIAAMTIAPQIGKAIAGEIGISVAAGTAVANFGLALAINSLIPIPQPSVAQAQSLEQAQAFSISGIQNQARHFGVIAKIYGEHPIYPDIVQQWTSIDGNEDQFLHIIFVFGLEYATNDLDITDLKLGQTAISHFNDVDYLIKRYGDLSPGEKDQWSPHVLQDDYNVLVDEDAGYVTRTTKAGADGIEVDIVFPEGLAQIRNDGGVAAAGVDLKVEISTEGQGSWTAFQGPGVAQEGFTKQTFPGNNLQYKYYGSRMVESGNLLYWCGGNQNTVTRSTLYSLDPTTETWTPLQPMVTSRGFHGLSAINGKLYAFGGKDAAGNLNASLEIYDIATDTWTLGASMVTGRWGFSFITVSDVAEGQIWIFGGAITSNGLWASLGNMVYDVASDSWQNGHSSSYSGFKNVFHSVAAYDPNERAGGNQRVVRIFSGSELNASSNVAGLSQYFTTFYFTPENINIYNNSYAPTYIPALQPRQAPAISEIDGKLYITGGVNSVANPGLAYTTVNIVTAGTTTVLTSVPLINGLGGHAQAVDQNGVMWILGGHTGIIDSDDLYRSISSGIMTIRDSKTSIKRLTLSIQGLSSGKYDVRVKRESADSTSTQILDKLFLTAIRSFKNSDPINFQDIKCWFLKIRASNQLSGIINSANALARAKLPGYNGASITAPALTRSPALAIMDVLRSSANKRSVPDSKIDFDSIKAFDDFCTSKGFTFDAIINGRTTVFQLCTDIGGTSRGKFEQRDGLYSVSIDQIKTPISAITAHNSSGISVSRSFRKPPDAIRARFKDATNDHKEQERIVYDDGKNAGNSTAFEEMQFWGITETAMVDVQALYRMRSLRLRSRHYTLLNPPPPVYIWSTSS